MPTRNPNDLHPTLHAAWVHAEAEYRRRYPARPVPFLTCCHRTNEEQEALFAQGRTTPGAVVTRARAGQSPHNFLPALAFDIAFKRGDGQLDWSPNQFKDFATVLSSVEPLCEWGGNFPGFADRPHYQLKGWSHLIQH